MNKSKCVVISTGQGFGLHFFRASNRTQQSITSGHQAHAESYQPVTLTGTGGCSAWASCFMGTRHENTFLQDLVPVRRFPGQANEPRCVTYAPQSMGKRAVT